MAPPKRTALKMTTGFVRNWYGVVTSKHDDDPTTVEYILATEHARIVAEKDARIAELEDKAKSETDARRDAFEEAAKVADQWATDQQRQFGNGGPAAAIRALAEKG